MRPFPNNMTADGLQDLPPLSQTPGYEVIEGNPLASIRVDIGSMDSHARLGIWRCTEGTFRCTEKGDELQTVLSGKLILTGEDGVAHVLIPGDSIFTNKGERVTWQIVETVTKVFFTHDTAAV